MYVMQRDGLSFARAILEVALQADLLSRPRYGELLADIGEEDGEKLPSPNLVWDAQRLELRIGSRVIRRLRSAKIAKKLTSILDEFERNEWPPRVKHSIDVSLSTQPVHDAVRSLNRNLQEISFHVDDDMIYWKRR
ncbi:MAG TPA: hypothetical protein EYG57_14750 [Planctomycetes bacterium]|nr:hypothetical protein [Planctomycetota bacterium]